MRSEASYLKVQAWSEAIAICLDWILIMAFIFDYTNIKVLVAGQGLVATKGNSLLATFLENQLARLLSSLKWLLYPASLFRARHESRLRAFHLRPTRN